MISKFLLLIFFVSVPAFADRWGQHEGVSRFSLDADYFKSSQNLTNRGTKTDLPLGGKYQEIPVRLGMRHDPDSRFSFFGEVGLNSVRAENQPITRERTSLSHLLIGADFQLVEDPVLVIPEFRMMIPLSMIDISETEPFLNEGVFAIQSGIYVSKIFKYLWLSGYGGFNYRMGGRASLGLWNVMARFRFWSLFLDAEAMGSSVLLDDEDAFYPDNRFNYINAVNAGSYRYYSVNPETTEARAAIGIQLTSKMLLRLGYGQTLSGYRTAYGQTFFMNFQMDFGEGDGVVGGPNTIPLPEKGRRMESGDDRDVVVPEEEAVRSKNREDLEKELEDFVPDGMDRAPRRKRK